MCALSLSQPGMRLACACFASFCLFHWQASSSPLCRLNFKKGNAKLIKLESFPLPLHKRRFYKNAQLFSRYLLLTKPHSTALMLVFHTWRTFSDFRHLPACQPASLACRAKRITYLRCNYSPNGRLSYTTEVSFQVLKRRDEWKNEKMWESEKEWERNKKTTSKDRLWTATRSGFFSPCRRGGDGGAGVAVCQHLPVHRSLLHAQTCKSTRITDVLHAAGHRICFQRKGCQQHITARQPAL